MRMRSAVVLVMAMATIVAAAQQPPAFDAASIKLRPVLDRTGLEGRHEFTLRLPGRTSGRHPARMIR